jgi:phosphoserine phosphatase
MPNVIDCSRRVLSSSPVTRSVAGGNRPAAAFFDLDKTIIAKSSTLAYGPSFYRSGLISRGGRHPQRGRPAALYLAWASHQRMERIREQVSQLSRGWPAGRVQDIVTRHLGELILPYVYDEAGAYSDPVTDLPMLEAVGHRHAVNPDRALRRVAQQRGWPVLALSVPPGASRAPRP